MRLPELELVAPASVAEASRYLGQGADTAQMIAGGTDLLVALKAGQKHPGTLVDLSSIAGLDGIDYAPETGLELGAMVTLKRLARDPAIRTHYPALAYAAAQVGTPQLRAMGTLGGNICQDSCCMFFNRPEAVRRPLPPCHKLGGSICHVVPTSPDCWAPYAGDVAPALIALGAAVDVEDGNGVKSRPLADIFSDDGARPLTLEAGQMITKIRCPAPGAHSGATYIKLRPRQTMDYPVVGVAASLVLDPADMTCVRAVVVLTGVASGPKQVPEAGDLTGGKVSDSEIDTLAKAAMKLSYPVKNVTGADPGYRRSMVEVLVARALREALREARGEALDAATAGGSA